MEEVMSNTRRVRWAYLAAGAALIAFQALSNPATAQSNYPNRPIRILVGFSAGGAADVIARVVGAELSKILGQNVFIENKTGASANIATLAMVTSPPDGYTLQVVGLHVVTNPAMMEKIGYDPEKDLTMVSQVTSMPVIALARADSPSNSVQDLVVAAKSQGGLKVGTGGFGTASHLAAELLTRSTGVSYMHVPYRGGAPALQAVMAGDVDTLFDFMTPTLKSNVEAGKLKFLGVMQDRPTSLMPSIPPAASQGVPKDALMSGWYAVAVRAGTPSDIVDKLHASINAALKNQSTIDKLFDLGEVRGSVSPAECQTFYLDELKRWSEFIKAAGIKAQL
jgi:tripartite-type tricarboxylate transporter receptor subunit TctC